MDKAVIYARYSSDSQNEQSIEGQLRVCQTFAKEMNILVVDTYIDRAITGTTDNRVAFQKMLKDSAKGLFNVLIVYKLDRFTRNQYETSLNISSDLFLFKVKSKCIVSNCAFFE